MNYSSALSFLFFGVSYTLFAALQAHATCLDTAPVGDGWGWDGSASCKVPFTVTECIDSPPYDDGWGWNGSTSCRITPDTSSASSCIDTAPTGDGWGWNGTASCQLPTPATLPVSLCIDTTPVGDGWGWDGAQSCTFPHNQPPRTVTRTIMPVGDSITHGAKGYKSYRFQFITMLEQANCSYSMVGSQLHNEIQTDFTSPHESYSTMKADHFLTGHTTWSGHNEGIQITMRQFLPDTVLLHLGSNDLYFHESIESTTEEISQLIRTIKTVKPDSTVLVSNIIPWFGSSIENRPLVDDSKLLGKAISELVANFNNDSVIFVDVFTDYTRDMMISDLVHPNDLGEQHIAKAFFSAYQNANLCQ